MSTLIHNKKATFDHEILERFEAGIELLGPEVKSIKSGHGSLDGAYVIIRGQEVYLINMHIPPYQAGNLKDYDPIRHRKLLLTKPEIERLSGLAKGLTIVPISVYNKRRKIKVEIASVKSKKKFDKRETIKKRDTDRELRRSLKYR